jgi:hypothetical protein
MSNPYESEVGEPIAGRTGAPYFRNALRKAEKGRVAVSVLQFFFSFGMGRVNRVHRSR